jgi:predicted dienelactone hydrolase
MLALLACTPESPDTGTFDPAAVATAPGEFPVGHGETELAYTDLEGASRTLRTSVWWPAGDDSGGPASYFHGTIESEGAHEGAPVADGAFPMVVYSHGHQAYAESSSFLMEHLASHGWLVVAPDHTGNTTLDGSERITAIYLDRPRDLSACMDALAADALPAPASAWNGDAVVMGHSFGGYTSYALGGASYDVDAIATSCAEGTGGNVCADWSEDWAAAFADGGADARVAGLLAMAPGDYSLLGAEGLESIAIPTLLMTGQLDPENDGDGALYKAFGLARGDHAVQLLGAGHDSFTDFAGALDPSETLAPADGWTLIDAYALAFASHATGDDRFDALLDGSLSLSDAAVFE